MGEFRKDGIIAVYPSTIFPTKEAAQRMAILASLGLPWVDRHNNNVQVSHAWVEGDAQSGRVYATFVPRVEKFPISALRWLKMKELEQAELEKEISREE